MRESDIQAAVRLVFGQAAGFVVWRNNSGLAERDNRMIRYGVGQGGADLLGIAPGGLFLAVEVKQPGKKPTEEQLRFLRLVENSGGVACLCHSEQEAREQVRGIREGKRRLGW